MDHLTVLLNDQAARSNQAMEGMMARMFELFEMKEKSRQGEGDRGKKYLDHKAFQNLQIFDGGEERFGEWAFEFSVAISTQNQKVKDSM